MAVKAGWKEAPIAGTILEAGSSIEYITGGWRTLRPVRDEERCTNCMICWVYCPDSAILVEDGKMIGFDYDHCKGCGICSAQCPVSVEEHAHTGKPGKVIQMVEETSLQS